MKTNEEVLQMVQEERSLMEVIWRRKKNWIGHILRGESLLREVIDGRMIGNRPRRRTDGEGYRRWRWCLHKNAGRKAT